MGLNQTKIFCMGKENTSKIKRKIDFLTKQMEKIQPALQEKHAMKQAVMEMMSQKIQQLTALGATQAAKA